MGLLKCNRRGYGGLFSKAAYAYLISWNGSGALNLCLGQPLKGLFVVALAFTACPAA
jgi:TM2 domain-containing membrane protein YozV